MNALAILAEKKTTEKQCTTDILYQENIDH